MFAKDKVSQSMIDAVNGVISLDEKVTKKRSTDTLAGRVAIPTTAGDNEHTSYKVALPAGGSKSVEEEVELDEVLDTKKSVGSYLDKSSAKRLKILNSPENKIAHPDYDKSAHKLRKSYAGNLKVLNREDLDESYDDEDPDVARADRELKRMGAKPIRANRKTDPEKEMSKLSKKAPKEGGDDLDQDHEHKESYVHEAKKVVDRVTGKEYDPDIEMHKFLHNPKTVAALKRMKDEKGHGWPKSSFHTKEEFELTEMINIKSTSMGDVVKDFQTSDAPQFAGKSQAKRRQMAVAAKMAAEEYFIESSLEDRVDEIKKSAKAHFKKIKTNEEVELDEGERSDRKKSTLSVLDRIYKKASENSKLQKNRNIQKSKSKESGE